MLLPRWNLHRWIGLEIAMAACAQAALPWSLPSYASPADTPSAVEVHANIVFGKGRIETGDRDLLMDAYLPTKLAAKSKAAVVFVHGGGFISGGRSSMASLCQAFASKGFVAFTIEYRLMEDNPPVEVPREYPDLAFSRAMIASYIDTKTAIRYVYANADVFGIDTSNIFLGGESAGAIASLVAGATPPTVYVSDSIGKAIRPENSPGFATRVRAVVDWCGGMFLELPQLDASDPPIVIYHGEEDLVVPYFQATDLKARCNSVGLECEFHSVPGAGHCPESGAPDGSAQEVMTSFVMRHLKDGETVGVQSRSGKSLPVVFCRVIDGGIRVFGLPKSLESLEATDVGGRILGGAARSADGVWEMRPGARKGRVAILRGKDEDGTIRSWVVSLVR